MAVNSEPFDVGPFAWIPQVRRPVLATALVSWAPLVVLAAIEGLALRQDPHESALRDFSAYGRYLVAAPVLVYANAAVLPRIARVTRHFADGSLVREDERPLYEEVRDSTRRLLTSRWADVVIVAVACATIPLLSTAGYPEGVSSWVRPIANASASHLSFAGWWRTIVSQPLLNALIDIWIWRLLLWVRFTYRMTRFDLKLVAAHPDSLGGLRFTLGPIRGFAFLAFAVGAICAGSIADSVLLDGATFSSFRTLVIAQVIGVAAVFAGPSLLWMETLIRLQGSGTIQYGELASRVGRAFQRRWFALAHTDDDRALGAEDFSATTDLYSITGNVRRINVYVLDAKTLILLVGPTLLPYVPLALTVMPLEQVLRLIVKAFA